MKSQILDPSRAGAELDWALKCKIASLGVLRQLDRANAPINQDLVARPIKNRTRVEQEGH